MVVGPPQTNFMMYISTEHGLGYIIVLLCKTGGCYICACCNLKFSLQACSLSDPRLLFADESAVRTLCMAPLSMSLSVYLRTPVS